MAERPSKIEDVPTPCFLVDIDRVKENCQRMIDRCQKMGVKLRPHVKTHKTIQGAELMTAGTKRRIVVSTLTEAEFYADAGFDDIVYGAPFTLHKIPRLMKLSERLEMFHVMVDSCYGIEALEKNPLPNNQKWSTILKINAGYNRAGVKWDSEDALKLARILHDSPVLHFHALYTHDGESYDARGTEEIKNVGNIAAEKMITLAEKLKAEGIEFTDFGTGSTPSSSQPGEKLCHLTELHPGNYIFYDSMQASLTGSCSEENIACRVATRVTGHYPEVNKILVDCGFTALSHDGIGCLDGAICIIQGHPELRFYKMSQEVGYIQPKSGQLKFEDFPIGSLLFLYPYHSCATACMHPVYYVHSGEDIVDMWMPCRGW